MGWTSPTRETTLEQNTPILVWGGFISYYSDITRFKVEYLIIHKVHINKSLIWGIGGKCGSASFWYKGKMDDCMIRQLVKLSGIVWYSTMFYSHDSLIWQDPLAILQNYSLETVQSWLLVVFTADIESAMEATYPKSAILTVLW